MSWHKTITSSSLSSPVLGYGVAFSSCGYVWVGGSCYSSINIDGHILNPPAGSFDPAFIAGFNAASGAYAGGSILQSGGEDQMGIACDAFGSVYLCSDYEQCAPFIIGNDTLADVDTSSEGEWMYAGKYSSDVWSLDSFTTHSDSLICPAATMLLYAPPGYASYYWAGGDTASFISVNAPGIYTVKGSSYCPLPCIIDTVVVTVKNIDLPVLPPDTVACTPVTLAVPLTGVSCTWQGVYAGNAYTASQSGMYYVAINEDGCTVSDTINVSIIDVSQHLRDTTFCSLSFLECTLIANAPAGSSVLWSTGSVAPSIIVADTGRYWVTVTNAMCSASDTMQLKTELCNCEAYLPTAFTPNDDGKNDTYHPVFENGCYITGYSFAIYNRWGELVFSSHTTGAAWDGTYNGAKAEIGTYMYYLKYATGLNEVPYTVKGDIILIR